MQPTRKSQPFSKQQSGQRQRTKDAFSRVVDGVGGSDLWGLVKTYIKDNNKKQDNPRRYENTVNKANYFEKIIDRLGNIYQHLPNARKVEILSLLVKIVPLSELKERGWKTSEKTWSNAHTHARKYGYGMYNYYFCNRVSKESFFPKVPW